MLGFAKNNIQFYWSKIIKARGIKIEKKIQIRKSSFVWSVRHALAYGKRSSRYGDECGLFWWFQTVVCGCVRIITVRSFHKEMHVHDRDTVRLQRPFISFLPFFSLFFPWSLHWFVKVKRCPVIFFISNSGNIILIIVCLVLNPFFH
jgi:hypothetical protein